MITTKEYSSPTTEGSISDMAAAKDPKKRKQIPQNHQGSDPVGL